MNKLFIFHLFVWLILFLYLLLILCLFIYDLSEIFGRNLPKNPAECKENHERGQSERLQVDITNREMNAQPTCSTRRSFSSRWSFWTCWALMRSDISLKLASSFSRSCWIRREFCSCISSKAWPVTSISFSSASSSYSTINNHISLSTFTSQ